MNQLNIKNITTYLLCLLASPVISHCETFACGNNEQAKKLTELIINHKNQQRIDLLCNEKLNQIALIKAHFIKESENIWHSAGRMTPNQLLRHHGFKLPKTYPYIGNQVEALAGGEKMPEMVLLDFLDSEPHRKLLMGDDVFFREQNQIGAAYIADPQAAHEYYWVVIIADESNQTTIQEPVINVKPPVLSKNKRSRGKEIKERMYQNKVRSTRFQ